MLHPSSTTLRIGTRASALARWQAEWVATQLAQRGVSTELVFISTSGDIDQSGPIGTLPTQGVFTKEIQRSLLDGRVDLAVHSLKDLPTQVVPGLALAAIPPRESVADVLISRGGVTFANLPASARIGTGSSRRVSQLRNARADLTYLDIRGNVDTRLKKLDHGEYDAIVLAEAGLRRLGHTDRISELFSPDLLLSAVGQGALGLETRADDATTQAMVGALNDPVSQAAVLAERACLHTLRGGCLAPIGAWARRENDEMVLSVCVLNIAGTVKLPTEQRVLWPNDPAQALLAAEELGVSTGNVLIAAGAERLILESRAVAGGSNGGLGLE
ncbi:MAG: hydroxymethylbilane synthase [Pirellulales bacterium]|nr:hydroxymethylbilane synthase [Pirellulales bacterium]